MAIVRKDNTIDIKIIQPGKGSSGVYPETVLKRDKGVFKTGTKMYWDHQTAQEEAAKPEGSLSNLAAELVEDAKWQDNGTQGAGLYAKAKVFGQYKDALNELGPHIGVSIRAKGKASVQDTVDYGRVPVIESIDTVKSVDFVTIPGAGGRVLELFESAKHGTFTESARTTVKDNTMAVDQIEFTKLQEANRKLSDQVARLTEAHARASALVTVDRVLKTFPTLPKTARERVRRDFESADLAFTESGTLDTTALTESVKNAIATETAYLTALGVGSVRGLGTVTLGETANVDPEKMFKEFAESLNDL